FQDLAVAVSIGMLADPVAAQDAAQGAFVLAMIHLGDLHDPAAFPGWFARLVRTACTRRLRSARPAEPLGHQTGPHSADTAEVVVTRVEQNRLRMTNVKVPIATWRCAHCRRFETIWSPRRREVMGARSRTDENGDEVAIVRPCQVSSWILRARSGAR